MAASARPPASRVKKPPSSLVTPPPWTRTTTRSGGSSGVTSVPARCSPSSVRRVTAVLWAAMQLLSAADCTPMFPVGSSVMPLGPGGTPGLHRDYPHDDRGVGANLTLG